jgi:hypothetical protein
MERALENMGFFCIDLFFEFAQTISHSIYEPIFP